MRTLWRLIASFLNGRGGYSTLFANWPSMRSSPVLVLVCIGIWSQFSSTTSEHAARGALLLDITGVVVDKPSASSKLGVIGRQLFGASSDRLQENSLFDIVQTIRRAKDDRNITGIVLDLKNFVGGDQPSMQYIGKRCANSAIAANRCMPSAAATAGASTTPASFANKIWLSPQGEVDLHGFATNGLYYKSLLDKLKVSTHVFRVGTYKSAVEPFIRDDMSPAAREAG